MPEESLEESFSYWRGHVDAMLQNICSKIDSLIDGVSELNNWKSGLESAVQVQAERLNEHERRITALENKNGGGKNGHALTYKDLVNDWGKPIAIGFVLYLLFQFIPAVIASLGHAP